MNLTDQEKAIVVVVRLNKETPKTEVRREWKAMGWRVVYSRKSSKNLWGRFGGGWNWKLGVMVGGTTVIFDLLVCSIRINRLVPTRREGP